MPKRFVPSFYRSVVPSFHPYSVIRQHTKCWCFFFRRNVPCKKTLKIACKRSLKIISREPATPRCRFMHDSPNWGWLSAPGKKFYNSPYKPNKGCSNSILRVSETKVMFLRNIPEKIRTCLKGQSPEAIRQAHLTSAKAKTVKDLATPGALTGRIKAVSLSLYIFSHPSFAWQPGSGQCTDDALSLTVKR